MTVNLSMSYFLTIVFDKMIQPVQHMFYPTVLLSTRKIVNKTFSPVLDILHCPLNQNFVKGGMDLIF